MNELEAKLIELMQAMGLSVDEFVTSKLSEFANLNSTDLAVMQAKLAAIDVALDGVEDGDITVGQNILAQITGLGSRMTAAEAEIAGLKTDAAALNTRVTATETATTANTVATATNTSDIATLNGDDTVVGSVAKAVKDGVAVETAARETADGLLQTNIDAVDAKVAANTSDIADMQAELDATQLGAGLNADGSFTGIDGSQAAYSYGESVNGDADTLAGAIKKVAKTAKEEDARIEAKVDTAQAAIDILNSDATVDGSVAQLIDEASTGSTAVETARSLAAEADLQTQIDTEIARASAAEEANAANLATLNGNDTVNGSVAKTVKDSVAVETARATAAEEANAAAITAETTARIAADAALQTAIDTLDLSQAAQDVKIAATEADVVDLQANKLDTSKVTSLDIVTIENAFRLKLGLTPNSTGGVA